MEEEEEEEQGKVEIENLMNDYLPGRLYTLSTLL